MADVTESLERARAQRQVTCEKTGGVRDDQMLVPGQWRGQRTVVRALFYRILDNAYEQRVALATALDVLGWEQTEAQRILGTTMDARGGMRTALLGVPADLVDQAPDGEWSIRQVLEHCLNTEERYRARAAWSLERQRAAGDLPVQTPEDRMPPRFTGQATTTGDLAALLAQLHDARQRTLGILADATDAELAGPCMYGGQVADLRYALHRFAAHDREHTIQIVKTLRALGYAQTEAQLILGQAEMAYGAIEGLLLGVPDEVAARSPGAGRPSVQDIIGQALKDEAEATAAILNAVG